MFFDGALSSDLRVRSHRQHQPATTAKLINAAAKQLILERAPATMGDRSDSPLPDLGAIKLNQKALLLVMKLQAHVKGAFSKQKHVSDLFRSSLSPHACLSTTRPPGEEGVRGPPPTDRV